MSTAHLWGDGAWWGLLGMASWIAFWALVLLIVLSLARSRVRGSKRHPTSALRTLEERYARGEVGPEEFTERRAVLLRERPDG